MEFGLTEEQVRVYTEAPRSDQVKHRPKVR